MKRITGKIHMSINIRGMLEHYRGKSMGGIITDNRRPLSDEEARNYLYDQLAKGYIIIPCCDEKDCPEFDYYGSGCPGHDVHYYDDNDNEITKEEYEKNINNINRRTICKANRIGCAERKGKL